MSKHPTLSIILPVYNEAENIKWFYQELCQILEKLGETFEIIYVNDGSKDDTEQNILALAKKDKRIIYICLARNFGKEAATSAGIHGASGDAAVILDGDGQHPPEKIPEMVALWRQGFQHVVGIRGSNEKAGFVKNTGSKVFYMFAKLMGADALVAKSTDFRLIDRELIETFRLYGEKKRMTRSLLDWSGYTTTIITFDARERTHGSASYTLKALFRLALNGYVGSTLRPLYLVGSLGALITVLSGMTIILLLLNEFLLGDVLALGVKGTAYIALLVTFLVGILMISQGIVAAYVANIHLEAQNRPLYIINKARSIYHR